ncbi:hypothetical protein MW887_004205 [Aspergillus wentii]|nr:hypothetical protein MW887_004205 [Aspergillus wentii]
MSASSGMSFREQIALQLGKPFFKLDSPHPQPFYHYTQGNWESIEHVSEINGNDTHHPPTDGKISKIRLTTWNIDFQADYTKERMAGALGHLSHLHEPLTNTKTKDDTPPAVIFLQEMLNPDIEQIKQEQWVRDNFFITDVSDHKWESFYGTTTLIDKRLEVERVFRVPYGSSRMQRGALFVDVKIGGEEVPQILRLCNTHLESLISNPPRRPVQLKCASEFMHGSGPSSTDVHLPSPYASILAGDLNAFAPEDQTAAGECGLNDAFLVLGGKDGTDESFTWGQQASDQERWRIGEGLRVTVNDEDFGEDIVWVTDHLGLQADFKIIM